MSGDVRSEDVRDLLDFLVSDVEIDPYLGQKVVVEAERHRPHLLRTGLVFACLVVLALVGALIVAAPWESDSDVVDPAASPPASGSDDSALLDGPVGPKLYAHDPPLRLLGRAYEIGAAHYRNGRPATRIVFAVDPTGDRKLSRHNAWEFCTALWTPGSPVSAATIEQCPGGSGGNSPAFDVLVAEQPLGGASANGFLLLLRRDVARAEVKLTLKTDLAATATPEGGRPPVRRRSAVHLVGEGDGSSPFVFGLLDPLPNGYVIAGTTVRDAGGRVLLDDLHGWYCGPDPKDGKTYLECPG